MIWSTVSSGAHTSWQWKYSVLPIPLDLHNLTSSALVSINLVHLVGLNKSIQISDCSQHHANVDGADLCHPDCVNKEVLPEAIWVSLLWRLKQIIQNYQNSVSIVTVATLKLPLAWLLDSFNSARAALHSHTNQSVNNAFRFGWTDLAERYEPETCSQELSLRDCAPLSGRLHICGSMSEHPKTKLSKSPSAAKRLSASKRA